MFWKFNLLTSSHVDTLLDKEDVTLHELMDEDDVLQECKAQNRKLVDFITRMENMEELVKLITTEPPDDVDEKVRFKYPNTACELLTSDVPQINERLAGEVDLVNRLYSFLEGEKPLNPLLASFFSKVMGLLITRKSEMIFEYLKSRNDFVGRLLYHIGTSAVMDLLLRLITCIESSETRRNVIEWLNKEKIVEKLVDSIVPDKDEDIHCNAAQSLCDIVRLGREQFIQQHDATEPDPLLNAMEQEETVAELLSRMFDSNKNESVLVNGLCVIHTLLEIRRQGTDPCEQLPNGEVDRFTQGINNVIAAIIPRLKDFHDLLVNPPKQRYSRMPTSVGCLEPPLGNTRLQVAKLVTALVGANMHQVNTELASLGAILTLLDLCFKYEWNNFLHTQVEQCLLTIVNNGPVEIDGKHSHPLLTQLFVEYNLIQRLLAEWEDNEQRQKAVNGKRRGFMGHLTKMVNSISGFVEKNDSTNMVKDLFNGLSQDVRDKWAEFVAGAVAEVNKKNAIELMRGPLASSSEDDDTDFKDIPFPQDTAMQQAFSDYQLQQMTSNFIDQFGFNDEEFAEHDDKIEAAFSDRISNIDAELQSTGINQPNTTLFDQACHERIQQFDNDDSDEDVWEDKHVTFDKTVQPAHLQRLQVSAARCNDSDEDSTDSREELASPVRHVQQQQPAEVMDVDNITEASSSHAEPTAMDTTGTAWDKSEGPAQREEWANFSSMSTTQPVSEENWADFSSFVNFQSSTTQGPRSSSPVEMDTQENVKTYPNVMSVNQGKGDSALSSSNNQTLPGDIHVEDLESPSNPNTQTPKPPQDNDNWSHPPDSSSLPLSNSKTSSVDEDAQMSSADLDSGHANSVDSASESSPALVTSQDPVSTADCNHVVASDAPDSSPSMTKPGVASPPPSAVSGNVDDNQSFLATSGLLRDANPVPASCPSSRLPSGLLDSGSLASPPSPPAAAVPPASPTPEPDSNSAGLEPDITAITLAQKIELARAQAKEAQEMYEAATAVLHNGPV